eukprot:TRINITY_DN5592_c0_g1_i3.p1 TRINITY_DN5592_c0_g1~~TRINITY_DN5592_c0_g1_i3.p1  ORF type:complete len:168 (+),score=21.58 TRINITY_DN5592_c0_g1_i3:175-678(+)
MDQQLFNLKLAAKQLERMAKKAEKEEKTAKTKCKKAMEKGQQENARVYAENAIRQKNQHTQFLRMAARVDAVSQRVQTAVTMRQVTMSMKGVVKSMDRAMASMNLTQLSQLMDKFEKVIRCCSAAITSAHECDQISNLRIWTFRQPSWKAQCHRLQLHPCQRARWTV